MLMDKKFTDNLEPLYRNIFYESREPRLLIDPETGRIVDANIRAFSVFGVTLEDLINKNIINLLHIHDKELLLEFIRVFAGQKDFFIFNLKLNSVENKTFEVYPSKCNLGSKKFLCLTFYDITDAFPSSKTLLLTKESFSFLLNESSDIIFISDKDGNLLDVSKKALELSAFDTKEQLLKKNLFEDLFANRDIKDKIIHDIQAEGACRGHEIVFLDNNYNRIILVISAFLNYSKKGTGDLLITIASIKRDNCPFDGQSKLFMLKMDAIEQIAKGVAHEFNNILSGIIGFAELLKMQIGHDERTKSYIDKLLFSANRGAHIVRDLNTFSQRTRSVAVLLDINQAIMEFKKFIKEQLNHNIIIELDLAKESPTVMADPNQIRTVLLNLFSNSEDAMGGQGVVKISTELVDIDYKFRETHGFGVAGRYVLISYTDSGGGIDEKIIDRIFEPFYTTKEVGKGSGLGLSIVYGIIKQHNGFITVSSHNGFTSFRIFLPYLMSFKDLTDSKKGEGTSTLTYTILVVEDNEVINTLIKDILEGSGYKVIQAMNGEEAAQILKYNDKIDVIIINPKNSLKNGSKVSDFMKILKPDVKMIFLNGLNQDIVSLNFNSAIEGNIIRKTFSAASLLATIKESLNISNN